MRILGLDMATHTGFAVASDESSSVGSGALIYRNGKRDLPLVERLAKFKSDVWSMIGEHMPDAVVYEKAHHRGGPATRSGLGMETILIVECFMRGVPCFGVHSATLKKFASGSGRAEKGEMMIAASRMTCRDIIDDNEADAICLAKWGVENVVSDKWGVTVKPIIKKRVSLKSKGRTK